MSVARDGERRRGWPGSAALRASGRPPRPRAEGRQRSHVPGSRRALVPRGLLATAALVGLVLGLGLAAAPLGDGALRPLTALDTTAGLAVYEANCAACHGFAGEGLTGAVPPLAGNVPRLVVLEGGREYLVGVLLHGLSGEIEVAGRRYDGLMPSWAHLGEQQVADVLNFVATAWGNAAFLPPDAVEFTALEVTLAQAFPADHATLGAARRALTRLSEQ